ncbi:MAG: hypothetical protein AAF499_00500 [Pseudomonadota bacterium]
MADRYCVALAIFNLCVVLAVAWYARHERTLVIEQSNAQLEQAQMTLSAVRSASSRNTDLIEMLSLRSFPRYEPDLWHWNAHQALSQHCDKAEPACGFDWVSHAVDIVSDEITLHQAHWRSRWPASDGVTALSGIEDLVKTLGSARLQSCVMSRSPAGVEIACDGLSPGVERAK